MNTTDTTSTGRKLLIPLATMAVAGAVAIGSGATWTAQEPTTTAIASGALSMTADGATLNLANLKPGDTRTGVLTISNTGSIDANLAIQEVVTDSNDFFLDLGTDEAPGGEGTAADVSDLQITIDRDGTVVYDGNFGGLSAENLKDVTNSDPLLAASTENTDDDTAFTFTVELLSTAHADSQSKSAGATYTFTTTQVDGDDADVDWTSTP